MTDLINRQDVNRLIDEVMGNDKLQASPTVWYCLHQIKDIPSAHRKGHWEETDAYPHRVYCSNCYKTYLRNKEWIDELGMPMNFCPNCGSFNGGEEDD